ncbi:MAG: efflux RND transporter permease subunit [Bacteroidales bacterium]|jgi:multidrug efflux pump subunit AcrB|nr:efflux RND transporter permease subunit [Bacteroidales bacterium]
MKITELAIKNSQFTIVMFLMVVVLGISTILTMPRSEDPELHTSFFPVVIVYPGTSPKDMEELVVDPLEKKIYALENIKRIKSNIGDGIAVLNVEYAYGTNADDKYQELVREVNATRKELPEEIVSIEVQKVTPSSVNVIQTALVSENISSEKLRKKAEDLQDELEKIPALKNVEIHGLEEQLVRVDLHPEKMARMNLPLNAVFGTIQSEMSAIPGGSIEAGNKSFNVKTSGKFTSVEDIRNAIVYSVNGRNIFMRDIADVYQDMASSDYNTRLNGHRCVFVVAALKPGNNITSVQKVYKPVIGRFKKSLPPTIDLVQNFDQADNVNKRLTDLGTDFLIAILLLSITLLPLGFRSSLIVMISIPLSLAMGIIFLNMTGFTLTQMTIVGLVVALGILVDDSIVVIENIERWMLQGFSRKEAVLKATNQIGLAVTGCTITLIIAFLPLAFMPETAGDFIRGLPMAVVMSVLASLVVSLTVIPLLAGRILKEHQGPSRGNIFMRGMKRLLISGLYSKVLNRAIARPWITISIAGLLFAGSLALFKVIGTSLFPSSEKPQFLVRIETPLQSGLAYTDSITHDIERQLAKEPHVKYFASNIGKGNPQVYYNVPQANVRSDFAEIFVQLNPETNPKKKLEIIESLRKNWTPYPGARVEVKNFEQGMMVPAPVEVRLFGENLDTLRQMAGRVETLLKGMRGTMYVNNPVKYLKTDMIVAVNKDKAQQLGIPTVNIGRTVRMAVAGLKTGRFTDADGTGYDILVGTPHEGRPRLDVFNDLYVNSNMGAAVPLKQLASLRLESSPLSIDHYNKIRTISVTSFVRKGFLNDNVNAEVIGKMDKFKMPAGYSYSMGGEFESRNEAFGGFTSVIIVATFLFISVLILLFKSFRNALIVLSVIPLGLVGAMTALWITGNSVSFVAIIGLIALAGIEVKNTILLVDFTNQMRREGTSLDDAIRSASEIRFLPIILTSMTAIGGLMPIAISTNPLISPLAIVIIGGLISSTLLSRIVTPVIYKLMPPVLG